VVYAQIIIPLYQRHGGSLLSGCVIIDLEIPSKVCRCQDRHLLEIRHT
jgi:hypothetical protein